MADIDIDIDAGTVTVPVDLGIWREGQTLDVSLDDPSPVGAFLDNLLRLLGLPRRTRDGQPIDYWLQSAGELTRMDETAKLNEIEVPTRGLVLGASHSAFDIRNQIDQLTKGISDDIRKAIDDEIQKGVDEVKGAATAEINGVIRDVREQVTRRVVDLIPGGRDGMKAQFQAAIGLRRVARTDAFVEYQDAVDSGLGRALGRTGGAWRAFTALGARAASAGAAGSAAAVGAATVVTVVAVGALSLTGALNGDDGDKGDPGEPGTTVPVTVGSTTTVDVSTHHTHEPTTTTEAPVVIEDREHRVRAGQTLWFITEHNCGEKPVLRDFIDDMLGIWVANIEKIGRDPNNIDIDQVLIIPCPEP